jgi:hypothetical protein
MKLELPDDPMCPLPTWRLGLQLAQLAARCGAMTRGHTACRAAAMPNGRCRIHGGASTGPRTAEGLARIRAARTKHGMRSAEADELRKLVRDLKTRSKQLVELV